MSAFRAAAWCRMFEGSGGRVVIINDSVMLCIHMDDKWAETALRLHRELFENQRRYAAVRRYLLRRS